MRKTSRFSLSEIYRTMVNGIRSIGVLRRAEENLLIDEKETERIMLAVTAVNRCAMCSYAHTSMALKAGLASDEIRTFLEGDFPSVPESEMKALLFAQNYAWKRGKVDEETWKEVKREYGKEKSEAILASIRVIMTGNALGIPMGSLKERLRGGKTDERSSLGYEILVLLCFLPFLLAASVESFISNLTGRPSIT